MQAKIRDAQLQKIPYMLVVGDKEAEAGAVAVRLRTNENLGAQPLDEFIAWLTPDHRHPLPLPDRAARVGVEP